MPQLNVPSKNNKPGSRKAMLGKSDIVFLIALYYKKLREKELRLLISMEK